MSETKRKTYAIVGGLYTLSVGIAVLVCAQWWWNGYGIWPGFLWWCAGLLVALAWTGVVISGWFTVDEWKAWRAPESETQAGAGTPREEP